MSNKKESQGLIDRIWNFFSSITLAVIVFSIISITSIVGTIIEQQAEPERNIKLLSNIFGDSAASVYKILNALEFTNMYHSWWFVTLLFIFAANLVICSLDRLPKIWKMAKEPIKPLPPEILNTMPIKRETVLKGKPDKTREVIESAMKKHGFKAGFRQSEGSLQFLAEKGRYSRLGVYATHFSILLILLGAVIGIFFGFNGVLNLLEGTSSTVAYMRNEKEIPLGFDIRCEDFEVSFYDDTDRPKSYRSWLTIMENGKEVIKKEIDVNTPLRYKGITFYQSSYGFSPTKDSLFKFTITSMDGKKEDFSLKFEESFTIPGTKIVGKVSDFTPALGVDQEGKLFTYAETMNNPAVFIEFFENGKPKYNRWILKRYPQTWKIDDSVVEFKDLWGAQYTGLQVRRDPGVWIVYLGSLVMGIGLYATFFMSHKRIWVTLRDEKNSTRVVIAASTNKNKMSLEQKIDKLLESLNK